jgi:hypothetical protein
MRGRPCILQPEAVLIFPQAAAMTMVKVTCLVIPVTGSVKVKTASNVPASVGVKMFVRA